MADNPTTEFGAKVPTPEYDYFKEQFPQYGAVTWFINQALIHFNEEVRSNPTVKDHVNRSVQQMLDMNRAMSASTTSD